MINVKRLAALIGASSLLLGLFSLPVKAVESDISPAHIERIRTNCSAAQNTLHRLHGTDALLRVNRGQVYESISSKLMAAMNGRIALNRLDGGKLIDIAARYEQELSAFRTSYQNYERKLSEVLQVDCEKQPVTFYDQIAQARQLRANVHGHVVKLNQHINDYGAAFDEFRSNFNSKSQTGSNS